MRFDSKRSSSIYSQQWQRFICNSVDKSNNNFSTSIAKFRSCYYVIKKQDYVDLSCLSIYWNYYHFSLCIVFADTFVSIR
ncbi:hypothetical protein QQG55_48295 [Brugia pahangi]